MQALRENILDLERARNVRLVGVRRAFNNILQGGSPIRKKRKRSASSAATSSAAAPQMEDYGTIVNELMSAGADAGSILDEHKGDLTRSELIERILKWMVTSSIPWEKQDRCRLCSAPFWKKYKNAKAVELL